MIRLSLLLAGALLAVPSAAVAQGQGGAPTDQLAWPGSPTDRYLSAGELRTVLHGATEGFFQCFRDQLRTRSEGGASVTFVVDRDGKARDIEVELGKAPAGVRPCVVSVVQGLTFSEHDGDPVPASYPLVYQVDIKGARILPYPIVFTKPIAVRLPLLALPMNLRPGELRMLELVLTEDGDVPSEDEEQGPTESTGGAVPSARTPAPTDGSAPSDSDPAASSPPATPPTEQAPPE